MSASFTNHFALRTAGLVVLLTLLLCALAPVAQAIDFAAEAPTLAPFISSGPEIAPGLYSTEAYRLSTLNRINTHRALAGVAPVLTNSQINAAAQAHADYLHLYTATGHEELSGLPGFTGQWHSDRMTAQGYSWSGAGEVISFGKDAQAGVDALIMAIYHRFIILSPSYPEVGIGDAPHAGYQMCQVIDFGRQSMVPAPTGKLAIYPADGQTEVPISFDSDTESPDPAPGLGVVGYPVSIQFSAEQTVTGASFVLQTSAGGTVDSILLQPGSNSNMKAGTPNFALIPSQPLQTESTYTATFSATVSGKAFTASWSFTTAPPVVLTVIPNPATFALGTVGELTILGGSGGYKVGWSNGSILTLDFGGTGLLITPKAAGTATITLTDNATGAVVTIPVTIKGSQVKVPLAGSRALDAGWNLLSLPLAQADTSASAVIAALQGQVISLWKWQNNGWAVALPPKSAAEEAQYAQDKGFAVLTDLDAGEGFWLNAAGPGTFSYQGLPPASQTLSFAPGWNLLGLKSMQTVAVGDIAYPEGETIISLWAWVNDGWSVTLPPELDGGAAYAAAKGFSLLQNIAPGQGFWANVE